MGWLRLVDSFNLMVSFAEYSLFSRALLQKRPIILRSLLIVDKLLLEQQVVGGLCVQRVVRGKWFCAPARSRSLQKHTYIQIARYNCGMLCVQMVVCADGCVREVILHQLPSGRHSLPLYLCFSDTLSLCLCLSLCLSVSLCHPVILSLSLWFCISKKAITLTAHIHTDRAKRLRGIVCADDWARALSVH